jgi:hypothetical protein
LSKPAPEPAGVPTSGAGVESGTTASASFDPADYTVAEVVAYVEANPEERATVLALEIADRNRTTLVAQLEAMA